MRAIDAEELLERFKWYEEMPANPYPWDFVGIENVIGEVPTIEVPTWIPVTERLPTEEDANNDGLVLALDGHKIYHLWHKSDFEGHPDWFVHWMPLPDAPKDGDT